MQVEDPLVVQVQDERFVVPLEQPVRVVGVIGVDGGLAGDQDHRPLFSRPARPAGPLPQAHHRRRQADAHHHVNRPDVDPEFQGAGREYRPDRSVPQPALDLLALRRGQPSPVDADERRLRVLVVPPDRAIIRSAAVRLRQNVRTVRPGLGEGSVIFRPASYGCSSGRTIQNFRSPWRLPSSSGPTQANGSPVSRSMCSWGDCTVAEVAMKVGRRAVPPAQCPQAAEQVADVRPEDAPVFVALVHHDIPEPGQEPLPVCRATRGWRNAACPGWSAEPGPCPGFAARVILRRGPVVPGDQVRVRAR